MLSIKQIRGSRNLRLSFRSVARLIFSLVIVLSPHDVSAESCEAPPRPFVPKVAQVSVEFADIIRRDFDLYFRDIQSYLRCLDAERARAFQEAREVSKDYGRFVQQAGQ